MVHLKLSDISKHFNDEAVICKVFNAKTNSKDNVKSIQIARAAPAGEGLIGAVYRVQIMGDKHNASFIIKALVKDLLLRKSLNCTRYFKREVQFYSEVLPILVELQKSMGATERIQNNVPICYGCHADGYNDYILIEDLSETGCGSISENTTKQERDTTLKALAHFHAVSMALRIKRPADFDKIANALPEVYYREDNRSWYVPFLQNAIDIDVKVLAEYEDFNSVYYKKFLDVVTNDAYGELIRLTCTLGDNPVINHGDAWYPNFMLSKERAVALDFQLLRCASPATDLSYFILLCANMCRNKSDFENAVKIYYDSLEYYLKDMGIDCNAVFPLETLNEEMRKYGKFGVIAILTSIPLVASDRCDVLESYEAKYKGLERIPLEDLWPLTSLKNEKHKTCLVNAVRVAVDFGLI